MMQEQLKSRCIFCKKEYLVIQNTRFEGLGSPRVAWANRSPNLPKVGVMSACGNSIIFYGTRKFYYTVFSYELYRLHFPRPHTVPQTSLTCKGSTSFGPFAMLLLPNQFVFAK